MKKEEQQFIKELYEEEPSLKKEGLNNFEGYYVHWDKIIEACGGGMYDNSPIELISNLIMKIEELKSEIDFYKKSLERIANEFGIVNPLQLTMNAKNNEENYVDILINIIRKDLAK